MLKVRVLHASCKNVSLFYDLTLHDGTTYISCTIAGTADEGFIIVATAARLWDDDEYCRFCFTNIRHWGRASGTTSSGAATARLRCKRSVDLLL